MVFEYQIGHGADALFWNQIIDAFNETYWSSGFDASTGGGSFEVDLTSGSGVVNGSSVSSGSQTVTLNSSDPDPRKDAIYINDTGNAQTLTGTAVAATPTGEVRANTYQPAPPDANGITGFVVAEVWIPGGASDITSSDIRDRRLPRPTYSDEDAQDAVGNILSSQFTYDDAGDSINLDPHKNDAAAHHSQPSTTQSTQPDAGRTSGFTFPQFDSSFNGYGSLDSNDFAWTHINMRLDEIRFDGSTHQQTIHYADGTTKTLSSASGWVSVDPNKVVTWVEDSFGDGQIDGVHPVSTSHDHSI